MVSKRRADRPLADPARWVLIALTLAGAMWAWLEFERTQSTGAMVGGFFVGFAALGMLGSLARCLRRKDALRAVAESFQRDRRDQPGGAGGVNRTIGAWEWVSPVLLIVPMAATLPVAYHYYPGDNSIVGALFAFTLVLAPAGLVVGIGLWLLVLFPLLTVARLLARRLAKGSTDGDDARALVVAMVFLGIALFATSIVFGTPPTPSSHSTRTDNALQFRALIFAAPATHPVWAWIARASVVLLIAAVVLGRRAFRTARGRGRQDGGRWWARSGAKPLNHTDE